MYALWLGGLLCGGDSSGESSQFQMEREWKSDVLYERPQPLAAVSSDWLPG